MRRAIRRAAWRFVTPLDDFTASLNDSPHSAYRIAEHPALCADKLLDELIVKVGQTVDVFIKAVDPEKKRISLGYKTEENNPWNIFLKTYNVGDVITVTVVSLMPFGAFAEIMPGVDGLIHNSQISDKMVSNPASVLKVGDKVEVKIIAVDADKNRISLSIRAAADPDYVAPEPPKAKEAPAEKVEEAPAETAAEEAEEAPTEAADEA